MVDNVGTTYLVRLRIPDRPGALGAVAARIGAVRGDVRGIEILERSETGAVDEFAVALASTDLLPLLVSELECLEDVIVEDISLLEAVDYDPQLAGFEIAAILVGADNKTDLFAAICDHVQRIVRSSFALVISEDDVVMAAAGEVPRDLEDVASISMPIGSSGLSLILGRNAPSFRARERQRAAALARISAAWLLQLEAPGPRPDGHHLGSDTTDVDVKRGARPERDRRFRQPRHRPERPETGRTNAGTTGHG